MNKAEKLYLKQMNAWLRTQKVNINSCAVNISNAKRVIKIQQAIIKAELEEKSAKEAMVEQGKKDIESINKRK